MGQSATTSSVKLEVLDDGAFWRVALATPKSNILDAAKIAELQRVFERARGDAALKGLVIEGEGPHFSFGASIAEHLPVHCRAMLASLHAMTKALLASDVVCVAAVRGQCLGAGLELVALCQRVFVAEDAKLGQPEIVLGVFAPVASVALPERIGRPAAEDLLLTGRTLNAAEALACGLADAVAADPGGAAVHWLRQNFALKSSSSLRFAVRAARAGFVERYGRELERLERLYLDELMRTHDAVEGLTAFLEKRAPNWSGS